MTERRINQRHSSISPQGHFNELSDAQYIKLVTEIFDKADKPSRAQLKVRALLFGNPWIRFSISTAISIIMVLAVWLLTGCSQNTVQMGGSTNSHLRWSSDIPDWSTNFNPALTTPQQILWALPYNQTCQSIGVANGSTLVVSGTIQISEIQSTDAPCARFDGTWAYQAAPEELVMCEQNEPCVTFQQ